MSTSTPPRSNCTRRLARKLATYAASGASLAAAPSPAAIVYTDLRPMGVQIDPAFEVDLNHDAIVEFAFQSSQTMRTTCYYDPSAAFCNHFQVSYIRLNAANNNGVRVNSGYDPFLTAGQSIQSGDRLTSRGFLLARGSRSTGQYGGSWGPFGGARGYVGVMFDIANGGRHAGWLQLEGTFTHGITLYGFAYETEPGMPIFAGDTGISPNVPGDTNADGQVDLVDLNNVRNNFGATGDGIPGDTNDDELIDLEDLNAVRNNFGATSGANPVPEPPSLVLLAAGAVGLALLRQRRKVHDWSK